MPLDDLPGQLIVPSRDDIRDQYLRDFRFRVPDAVTVEGTQEYADASVFADGMAPVYYDAKNIGDYVANVNKRGAALDAELIRSGTQRLPAAGGSGFVIVNTSLGGGTIFVNDEIKDTKSGLRFKCLATKLYTDGEYVPVGGIDTGPATNIAAGTTMQWTFPRPGINPSSIVVEQTDGTGIFGGRDQETDDEANRRLQTLRANPPAAGNDAQYQKAVLDTPGIPIQQAFTWPAIFGPGTIAVAFTLRPGTPGANRIPNSTQMDTVLSWLIGQFDASDSIFLTTLVASPVSIVYEVTWAPSAVGWEDASPWPPYNPSGLVAVDGSAIPTPTSFRLSTSVSSPAPQVGQSIAFYDQPNGVFRRKRIKSFSVVSAGFAWDLVADTVNGASDINYTPNLGQPVSPWSDSLQAIVTPTTSFFDTIGPGEQLAILPDPNLRQHRTPRSPFLYGNALTNRITTGLFELPTIGDIQLISPSVPFPTPIGAPGIIAYLLSLGNIVVFPQA